MERERKEVMELAKKMESKKDNKDLKIGGCTYIVNGVSEQI